MVSIGEIPKDIPSFEKKILFDMIKNISYNATFLIELDPLED